MEELSNLPTNMSEELRLKAEIELRSLRVLNFQRNLRAEVSFLYVNKIFFSDGCALWLGGVCKKFALH